MLPQVLVQKKELTQYEGIVDQNLISIIIDLSKSLAGARGLEINSTSSGGGVAELLRSTVPLMNALGIKTDWQYVAADQKFFEVTKHFHNSLQGMKYHLTKKDMDLYLEQNESFAKLLEKRPRARIVVESSTESEWVAR